MQITPYLSFDGRSDEAIEFYRSALGAEVQMLMRFKDCPDPAACQQVNGEKVMHAALRIGDSTVMLSDCRCEGKSSFQGFSLSITVGTEADAQRTFAALSAGGQVQMPLGRTFFSPSFGVVADRFGVSWMVYVAP